MNKKWITCDDNKGRHPSFGAQNSISVSALYLLCSTLLPWHALSLSLSLYPSMLHTAPLHCKMSEILISIRSSFQSTVYSPNYFLCFMIFENLILFTFNFRAENHSVWCGEVTSASHLLSLLTIPNQPTYHLI